MLIPKGTAVWVNLQTSFIDVDQLLFYLKRQEFTGYVHSLYRGMDSLFFLNEGDVVSGIREIKGEKTSGQQEVIKILDDIRNEKNGLLSIFRLSEAAISLFTSVYGYNVKLVHKDLSSDFTNLGKFIQKVQKDKNNAYLEIRFFRNPKKGFVLIERGEIQGLLTDALEIGTGPKNKTEQKLLQVFVQNAHKQKARYDCYALK
jgi:hypothetical protein